MPITQRTKRLKERCRFKHVAGGEYVDPEVRAGIQRARLITQSHKAHLGEPACTVRARGLENILTIELARLLAALRKVVSYVGYNVGDVVWSGMRADNAIELDPAPLLGQYPVPVEKTDRIIGLVVRKAFGRKEWSQQLRKKILAHSNRPRRYAYKFQLFVDMCERVYLDQLANQSVLGRYTSLQRQHAAQIAFDQASHPPTISELLHLWWEMAADPQRKAHKQAYVDRSVRGRSQRTSLEKYYREPIALLNTLVDDLTKACPRMDGVSERFAFRRSRYLALWPRLFAIIKYCATDSRDPFLQNSRQAPNLKGLGDELAGRGLPDSFADDVEKVLAKRTYDFTQRILDVAEDKKEIVRIKENNLVMPARNCVDRKLLHQLTVALQSACQKKTNTNRGLRAGKIDRRRIHRVPTTGTIFQLRRSVFELRKTVLVLVDATGSMAAPCKWEQTERIYQTLFTAIHAFTPKARLFAYNEFKNTCRITELHRHGRFYSILPHGKTASGEALIAAALYLKKENLILHLTDGASNWGCGVTNAIAYCRQHHIGLLTLGVACEPTGKKMLHQEYGQRMRFVDCREELPKLMRDLFRQKI